MSFRAQTTELQVNSPFEGKGILNDRLRFDVSGIPDSNPRLLLYSPTTKTFTWAQPSTLEIDTIYTNNATISEARAVTLATGTGSLTIQSQDDNNYIAITPESTLELGIFSTDYFLPDSNLATEIVMGTGNLYLSKRSTGEPVEPDSGDPAVNWLTSKNGTLEIDTTFALEFSQVLTGVANGEQTNQTGYFYQGIDSTLLESIALGDTSGGENSYITKSIGDTSAGFGFAISLNSTVYNNAFGYSGGAALTSSYLSLEHVNYSGVGLAYLYAQDVNANTAATLNLSTDLDVPLLQRTTTDGTTHEINFTPSLISITHQGWLSTSPGSIDIQTKNSLSTTTSLSITQGDTDLGLASSIEFICNDATATDSSYFTAEPDGFYFEVSSVAPSTSALATFTSTTQGVLLPRLTTVQRDAISGPVAGLLIYNTTTNKLNVYTTAWEAVTSA